MNNSTISVIIVSAIIGVIICGLGVYWIEKILLATPKTTTQIYIPPHQRNNPTFEPIIRKYKSDILPLNPLFIVIVAYHPVSSPDNSYPSQSKTITGEQMQNLIKLLNSPHLEVPEDSPVHGTAVTEETIYYHLIVHYQNKEPRYFTFFTSHGIIIDYKNDIFLRVSGDKNIYDFFDELNLNP